MLAIIKRMCGILCNNRMNYLSKKGFRYILLCFIVFLLIAVIINLNSDENAKFQHIQMFKTKTNKLVENQQRQFPSTHHSNIRLLTSEENMYNTNGQRKIQTGPQNSRQNRNKGMNFDLSTQYTARKQASETGIPSSSSIFSSTPSPMSLTAPFSDSSIFMYSESSASNPRSSNAADTRTSKPSGYDGPITYTKVGEERFYIYSAFSYIEQTKQLKHRKPKRDNDSKKTKNGTSILINGWKENGRRNGNSSDVKFLCCVLKKDESVEQIEAVGMDVSYEDSKVRLYKLNVMCGTSLSLEDIAKVTATFQSSRCPTNMAYYVPVKRIEYNKINGVGVCGKVAFDSLNATRVIEWLEAARLMGATKVFIYMNNLNANARRVMAFYENLGLVQAVEFSRPEMEQRMRTFHDKEFQTWSDKRVVMTDCQGLLSDYKYGLFLDTDEFIIPNVTNLRNSWMKLADNMLLNRTFAGVTFMTSMHLTSWPPSNRTAQLFIEEYAISTPAFIDRKKYIFIPERIKQGTCWSHSCTAVRRKSLFVYAEESDAVIHHYRGCRLNIRTRKLKDWTPELFTGKKKMMCDDYRRIRNPLVNKLANSIRDNVLYARKMLKL